LAAVVVDLAVGLAGEVLGAVAPEAAGKSRTGIFACLI
jgi:hypothetical protein